MTDELEVAIVALMSQVEEMGGAVSAIEAGFQKSEIERSAYRISQEIDSGERIVVGVNHFTIDEHEKYEPLRVDPTIGQAQQERLTLLRAQRDQDVVDAALVALKAAAQGSDNVLYPMRDALRAHATVGEVSDALREVWGSYTPADTF